MVNFYSRSLRNLLEVDSERLKRAIEAGEEGAVAAAYSQGKRYGQPFLGGVWFLDHIAASWSFDTGRGGAQGIDARAHQVAATNRGFKPFAPRTRRRVTSVSLSVDWAYPREGDGREVQGSLTLRAEGLLQDFTPTPILVGWDHPVRVESFDQPSDGRYPFFSPAHPLPLSDVFPQLDRYFDYVQQQLEAA